MRGRVGLWVAAAGLAGAAVVAMAAAAGGGRPTESDGGAVLVGPLAEVAARVQWVRAGRATADGRPGLALARYEAALALVPRDARAWELVALHLALDLGSAEREADPGRRLAWVRAGLDVLRRGRERVDDVAELAFAEGMVLAVKARHDPELPWPGGVEEMRRAAAEAFERAGREGHPVGEAAAGWVRGGG